ncbi:MAG TPA: hypothetical protein VNE40_02990 [Candidatus Dormibacteraeota bacterium]|nr:hypothetical protein [Candidatus Dormibacteraeota bacterium]
MSEISPWKQHVELMADIISRQKLGPSDPTVREPLNLEGRQQIEAYDAALFIWGAWCKWDIDSAQAQSELVAAQDWFRIDPLTMRDISSAAKLDIQELNALTNEDPDQNPISTLDT